MYLTLISRKVGAPISRLVEFFGVKIGKRDTKVCYLRRQILTCVNLGVGILTLSADVARC